MLKRILVTTICAILGLAVAIGGSLLFTQPQAVTAQQPPRVPSSTTTPANVVDTAFISEAGQAAIANIMLGELALRRSQNANVRSFAQAEINEQKQVQTALNQIAPRLGVQVPQQAGAKYQAIMARLSRVPAAQFDNAYLDEGGVNAHLENASLFQREAAFGQNPDLVAFVNKGLNTIRLHFTTASQLTGYQFAQVSRRYNNTASTTGVRSQPTNQVR